MSDAVFRWAGLLLGQGVILIGLILTHLSTRRKVSDVDTKVDVAADEARKAADAAAPTANGFAGDVRAGLAALHAGQQDLRTEMKAELGELRGALYGHIQDHAAADVRGKYPRDPGGSNG